MTTTLLDSLLYKIVPNISKKDASIVKDKIILCNRETLAKNLLKIDKIIKPYWKNKTEGRQNWICNQITIFFNQQQIPIPSSFIDIGGGNGNVLYYFATKYNLKPDDCFCVEREPPPVKTISQCPDNNEFYYTFSHSNEMKYMFVKEDVEYDSKLLSQGLKQVECIICMVALHHMTDAYIGNVIFPLIKSKLKPGGLLLLKEHNVADAETHKIVEWEHHLYYLMEQSYSRTEREITEYLSTTMTNYKSRETFTKGIETRCQCKCIYTLTNTFEIGKLDKTPSKLYWQIFQKQ